MNQSQKTKRLVTLVVGDWSSDGHEQTENFLVEVNLDKDELRHAYMKGSEIIGFRLDRICEEYQDNVICSDFVKVLVAHFDWDLAENTLTPRRFAELNLMITKLGNPNFDYQIVESEYSISIGGYGLFDCD